MTLEVSWRPVVGYEGLYEVSPDASIRHIPTARIKVPSIAGKGYLYVHFWKGNKRKAERLHRVVATAWVPNPNGLLEVNHKDGDKLNCIADNLEWSTRGANLSHARQTGLRVGAGKSGKLTAEQARAIRESSQPVDIVAAEYGVSRSTVKSIRDGQRWPYA